MKKIICLYVLLANYILISYGQANFKITHQPYIQGLTTESVHILWTTDQPATGWVELAPDDGSHFYERERPKFFAAAYGFKKVGKLHQVTLKNLIPGTRYRYRVYNQEVLKHEGTDVLYGKIIATAVYKKEPLTFKTLGKQKNSEFIVINDIHGRNEVLNKLLDVGDVKNVDFVVFNGDMANSLLSETQMFGDFMDTAIARFASETPMFYARGNHETRGPFAIEYPSYFPTPTNKLYYQFNHGNTGVIVLDCGEDKPDTDIEYAGIVEMDNYRTEQAEWLSQAVENLEFKNAKFKIVICHMPPFGGWHGELDILDKFVPILNKAGVQIMLSGHLHRHILQQKLDKVDFQILVNSNNNVVKASMTDSEGLIKVLDQKGVVVETIKLKPLN
ncbi:FN3 domain-containing metallophosphoesterase family protein [Sphingobacterium rhinopitheci]|uniref:FN3 domain-containing metallophosphoesterase family protein n=1 Tax=Sphingobacterium rhinopitheci TaxID=2781960 RepID=UPI001F51D42D|nr:FN3 domain-containing metallophosphoesterase family protein [Sphingobacterium rhinopitheci]MCI0922341.1 metallophosphoesterase family protein [Sphingobacterium rhinopitheci]